MYRREHYRSIAKVIRDSQTRVIGTSYILIDKGELVNQFITLFVQDNPRFDEKKFRKEIGE